MNKKLSLVRSIRDIDSDEPSVSRTVHHGHIALDAENEQVVLDCYAWFVLVRVKFD